MMVMSQVLVTWQPGRHNPHWIIFFQFTCEVNSSRWNLWKGRAPSLTFAASLCDGITLCKVTDAIQSCIFILVIIATNRHEERKRIICPGQVRLLPRLGLCKQQHICIKTTCIHTLSACFVIKSVSEARYIFVKNCWCLQTVWSWLWSLFVTKQRETVLCTCQWCGTVRALAAHFLWPEVWHGHSDTVTDQNK